MAEKGLRVLALASRDLSPGWSRDSLEPRILHPWPNQRFAVRHLR